MRQILRSTLPPPKQIHNRNFGYTKNFHFKSTKSYKYLRNINIYYLGIPIMNSDLCFQGPPQVPLPPTRLSYQNECTHVMVCMYVTILIFIKNIFYLKLRNIKCYAAMRTKYKRLIFSFSISINKHKPIGYNIIYYYFAYLYNAL